RGTLPPPNDTRLRICTGFAQFSGGYIGGVPPVPIPNTAVKPSRADGTARFPCGRVGRCRNFSLTPRRAFKRRGALLYLRRPVCLDLSSSPARGSFEAAALVCVPRPRVLGPIG